MTRGKWMLLLALLLGTLLLIGCGSKEEEKTPAPAAEQTQNTPAKEEPKAEPKEEAPKVEEQKTDPKPEAPKEETPKTTTTTPKTTTSAPTTTNTTTTKKTLNLGHDLGATYANNCATCHAGGAIFTKKPPHNIDGSTLACTTCHTLNPKS